MRVKSSPMHSEEVVISARNLTKIYRVFGHPGDRLRQAVSFGFKRHYKRFTAVEDVSFDIRKGETVGVVGRNGSGKSTLLQLICGILKPSGGSVRVNGRVSALLELGAGFNAEFTGRENVYFYCALQGLKKEDVDARFDDIAAFADIGDHLDQPVRTYSSGMFVRLAFAALIHVDADILVVDEALAVGDEAFQRKCLDRLEDMFSRRQLVLFFVSHNIRQVERMCSRAIFLEQGRIRMVGSSRDVCGAYHGQALKDIHAQRISAGNVGGISGSREVELLELLMFRYGENSDASEIEIHEPAKIVIRFRCSSVLKSLEIVVGFHTADSIYVASASSASSSEPRDFGVGEHRMECLVPNMMLVPGAYQIRVVFLDFNRKSLWDGHRLHPFTVISGNTSASNRPVQMGLVDMPFSWRVCHDT
jgi:ABC-type polysaccharide/polyol phosphate transport system ATPase subunit